MSRIRVPVEPALLEWARARSGMDDATWADRFPLYESWLKGDKQPTVKQLETFARRSYAPLGFLLLSEPPDERVPITDHRCEERSGKVDSANLLDTIYACQARQEWYRDHRLLTHEDPLAFVGSTSTSEPLMNTVSSIREVLGWPAGHQRSLSSCSAVLAALREAAERAGVLVVISGIVGTNTRRRLNPREFRGFSLVDEYSSLVFVNGTDSKAGQIFTLAHELARVWLGQSGLTDADVRSEIDVEWWCNQVAAEFLAPMSMVRSAVDLSAGIDDQLVSLAEHFRVSVPVILARLEQAGIISRELFLDRLEIERVKVPPVRSPAPSGGNFYYTKPVQVGKRFARELIASTLEGNTPYTEAFRLLEVRKADTLLALGQQLGVA